MAENSKIEYRCLVCREITRRKPTEPMPKHCPHCGEPEDWAETDDLDG